LQRARLASPLPMAATAASLCWMAPSTSIVATERPRKRVHLGLHSPAAGTTRRGAFAFELRFPYPRQPMLLVGIAR
jgi:hypothetical protein